MKTRGMERKGKRGLLQELEERTATRIRSGYFSLSAVCALPLNISAARPRVTLRAPPPSDGRTRSPHRLDLGGLARTLVLSRDLAGGRAWPPQAAHFPEGQMLFRTLKMRSKMLFRQR